MKVTIYFDQRAPGVPTCREACIGLRTHVSSGAAASDGLSGSKTRPRGTRPVRRYPQGFFFDFGVATFFRFYLLSLQSIQET